MNTTIARAAPGRREAVERFAASADPTNLSPFLDMLRPYTMAPATSLVDLARQVYAVLAYDIPGDFVECGVWRGGASFLMAALLREANVRDRKVWLFDSFEGIPPPEDVDGPAAMDWANNTKGRWYFDNLQESIEDVQRTAANLGLAAQTEFVKGWFDHTLPAYRERVGSIAILRIDCDWYASVRCCLEHFYDQVADGGFIILDDYYTFDGCALAVHEFLGGRGLSQRIESVVGDVDGNEYYHSAVFRKGTKSWYQARYELRWLDRVDRSRDELASLIDQHEPFIFVDDGQSGSQVVAGRRAIPFLERDGQHWGPPPDDGTAIRELERLHRSGATFIVFAWPAFWWLDYYSRFREYLRTTFRCAIENERLVAFDLRLGRDSER